MVDIVSCMTVCPRPSLQTRVVKVSDGIPDGWMGLDVGPETIKAYEEEIFPCRTIVWNGYVHVCMWMCLGDIHSFMKL